MIEGEIGCDLHNVTNVTCGSDGGIGNMSGNGFMVTGVLAISCRLATDCQLSDLHCIKGYCTAYCNTSDAAAPQCLANRSVCVSAETETGLVSACLARYFNQALVAADRSGETFG